MAQTNPFRIGDWLPFWSSLILFALGWFTVVTGGYNFLLVIAVVWYVVPILDQIMNQAKSNVDPETVENTYVSNSSNSKPFMVVLATANG